MPQISVIIPTFNRRQYLVQALDSVLAQKGADFEVLVSDNASTDGTAEAMGPYLSDPRVRYFHNESNVGMVANWRIAIFERARHDWFVLMSDDDYFTDENYLRRASALIDEGAPGLVYAGGRIEDVSTGLSTTLLPPFSGIVDGREVFAARGTIRPQDFLLCNVLFKRSDAVRLDFLHNENNLSSDSEFFLKLALEGPVGVIPDPVCVYRMHPGNLTKKILTSARLLRGNLEYLVLPHAHGVTLGTDAVVLERYRHNTRLEAVARGTLLRLCAHDRAMFQECRRFMHRHAPEVLRAIESTPRFRLLRALAVAFPPALRLAYGIGP